MSLITPEPAGAGREAGPKEFVASARLEGQIVVTLSPTGMEGEPITLTIPLNVKVAEAERLASAGSVEE